MTLVLLGLGLCWVYFRRRRKRIEPTAPAVPRADDAPQPEESLELISEPIEIPFEVALKSSELPTYPIIDDVVQAKQEEDAGQTQTSPVNDSSTEWLDPDPFELQVPQTQKRIVTRTSKGDGQTRETWVGEMAWPSSKEARALHQLRRGLSPQAVAIELKVDLKDVVYLAARKLYQCEGDLESTVFAFKDRTRWSKADLEILKRRRAEGQSVFEISLELGRTQLAVVWQLLERGA